MRRTALTGGPGIKEDHSEFFHPCTGGESGVRGIAQNSSAAVLTTEI